MANKTRIPRKAADFDAYMNATDDLQLTTVTPGTDKKWELWGWKTAESEQWTTFRQESNTMYALYSHADTKSPMVTKKMNQIIKKVRAYDNDIDTGHHLLDRIALNGTVEDCTLFNVVRSTTLQSEPVHHDFDPTMHKAVVNIVLYEVGRHVIEVKEQGAENKKLPEGMASVKVYRYMGKDDPQNDNQYQPLGPAKYGKIVSIFNDVVIPDGETWYAHYFAIYENNLGEAGIPGTRVKGVMMMQ